MHPEDPHLFREDPIKRNHRIADMIEMNPQECFQIALDNLDRWEAWGRTHSSPIHSWRAMILKAKQSPAELAQLVIFLRTSDPDREPLLSCSPFVGLPETPVT